MATSPFSRSPISPTRVLRAASPSQPGDRSPTAADLAMMTGFRGVPERFRAALALDLVRRVLIRSGGSQAVLGPSRVVLVGRDEFVPGADPPVARANEEMAGQELPFLHQKVSRNARERGEP